MFIVTDFRFGAKQRWPGLHSAFESSAKATESSRADRSGSRQPERDYVQHGCQSGEYWLGCAISLRLPATQFPAGRAFAIDERIGGVQTKRRKRRLTKQAALSVTARIPTPAAQGFLPIKLRRHFIFVGKIGSIQIRNVMIRNALREERTSLVAKIPVVNLWAELSRLHDMQGCSGIYEVSQACFLEVAFTMVFDSIVSVIPRQRSSRPRFIPRKKW